MIVLTPLKIVSSESKEGTGTGRIKGKEIFPYTETALLKLGIDTKELLPMRKPLEYKPHHKDILEKLRPYQKEDVLILGNRKVGAIFSEPRTGKTPTALSVMNIKEIKKFIIVCPTSIVLQWEDEILSWTSNTVVCPKGPKKKRIEIYENWKKGALVIGYDLVRLDVEDILKHNKDIECILVDEVHRIKNRNSQQTHAVNRFKKLPNKFVLTGTPAPNRIHEIYSILNFLCPNIFTGYWRFIEYYFDYTEQHNWGTGMEWKEIGGLKHKTELQEFIDRIAVRHTQAEVMPWLPKQAPPVHIKLETTAKQEKYLKDLKDMYETEHVIVDSDLTRLIRERQICNAPELLNLDGTSPKIDWIKQYLKDYDEESIIIFSNFTKFLKLLSEKLEISSMIIGETPKEVRNKLKNDFQKGKIKVLLINIKAGKEGLTLDEANTTIFCDTYPPSADVYQAEQRMTSTTEERAHIVKKLYRLMMKNTYDEHLYEVVAHNLTVTETVNDYKNYLKRRK